MRLKAEINHTSSSGHRQPLPVSTTDPAGTSANNNLHGEPERGLLSDKPDLINAERERAGRQNGKRAKIWLLRVSVGLGFLAFVYYLSWWFEEGRLAHLWLIPILVSAVLYWGMQMAGNWVLYLFAHRTPESRPFSGPSVDVFVTAYDEPFEMVERALAAACAMRGEHKTWLLDDGSNPAMAALANRLGAGYLTRDDHKDAKAGNVNAALSRTEGDIVVIFDIDHVPCPDFLERGLAPFANPEIGFVQVMLTFANHDESWVAKAAIETSLEFYNPTSLGADGIGGATLMGSNALIRRKALESIGGYQPGLAEDLATSISLHAAGWKSAYIAQPLAPGLAPPSFFAWFTQQLKWSRGVFELLLAAYPKLFGRLSWGQRLSYAVRMTKYWIGPAIAVHLFATIGILILGSAPVRDAFHDYLLHLAPLVFADLVIRMIAFGLFRHPATPKTSLSRAVALVYATWPIYALAWGMALLRLPLRFKPTPKQGSDTLHPVWLLPQIIALLSLIAGIVYTVFFINHPLSVLLLVAVGQATIQLVFLMNWVYQDTIVKGQRMRPFWTGPVAVLEVDFNRLPKTVKGLDGYKQAFCLVKMDGLPVGRIVVEVVEGQISGETLHNAILATSDWSFWQRWLQAWVGWTPDLKPTRRGSIAVAICTRDRHQDLRRCLEGVMQLPDIGQEVIVVDSSSSTDQTRETALSFPKVRYVREEIPGLNRARNRAMLETSAEFVAFIDDDAVPDPGWLEALVHNFQDPRVYAVTGLTMPAELETRAQQWFEKYSSFGRGFSRKSYDKDTLHPLAAGHVGAGVNMALRRAAFQKLGAFDEALDAGTPTLSGGDSEMFARILAAGYQIVYDPAALSWHRHRRDWKSLRKTIYGYGTGTYAYWTRKLLVEGEWSVLLLALQWALGTQIPGLIRSLLLLPGRVPFDLLVAEILGCLAGPAAYLKSRKQMYRSTANVNQPYPPYATGERNYTNP